MMRLLACAALAALLAGLPVRAGEIVQYKGATLVRQEERGMMVFDVNGTEVKAQPSLNMKGIDRDGKVYDSGIAAAEKHEIAWQLLRVGNRLDLKINRVNAKTAYIEEARLIQGEVLAWGTRNKVEKAGGASDSVPGARPEERNAAKAGEKPTADRRRPATPKAEKHVYSRATIKSYADRTVTFEADGAEVQAQVSAAFRANDRGQVLRKDDRYRIFREGSEATITTTKDGRKETLTDIRITRTLPRDK
jgi:hypothetical protein